jgi:hypothetical protein
MASGTIPTWRSSSARRGDAEAKTSGGTAFTGNTRTI